MRALLIGSDFMYDKNGTLKPIEINTNTGWHHNIVNDTDGVLDLNTLNLFISENTFIKIIYIGNIQPVNTAISSSCKEKNIEYENISLDSNSITIPNIEDNDSILIIRSAYDTTAIVDEMYCKDKIGFLNLIKDTEFGSQFVYLDESNTLVNNIKTINDNGDNPNFILKSRWPSYDKDVYPKFYKVSNISELNILISNVVSYDYFLMEFHYNPTKLIENNIQVFRGLNILFPPNLESISIGGYTRVCDNSVITPSLFDSTTYELIGDRYKYITSDFQKRTPKLLDTDLVQMEDGSFKAATELVVGDIVKTIDIPNPFDANNSNETVNYKIGLDELESETLYSTNVITHIEKINLYSHLVKLTFTDGSDWFDNENSKYLSIKNNEVRFLVLSTNVVEEYSFSIGDSILLIDTSDSITPKFISKEIVSIEKMTQFFGGYEISVENSHLFLTKSSAESTTSYVSIEHNINLTCYSSAAICDQSDCNKGEYCVQEFYQNPCGGASVCTCGNFCNNDGGPSEA
jgi:hypothetical protein